MTLILGLESSCDETAAALVDSDRRILAHRVAGQEAEHSPYGGVVPEIAARAHVDRPVSYTHLDVYKRQVTSSGRDGGADRDEREMAARAASKLGNAFRRACRMRK